MVDTTDSRGPALRRAAILKPAFLSTEYNDFLFASIGADASGTSLTVVSALARLDLDPWVEAAKFARMPVGVATQKLAELLSRFTEIPSARIDSAKTAARLTALLPANFRRKMLSPSLSVPALHPAAQALMGPRFFVFLLSVTLGVMLVMQIIVVQMHPAEPIKGAAQTTTHPDAPIGSPIDSNPHMTENKKACLKTGWKNIGERQAGRASRPAQRWTRPATE